MWTRKTVEEINTTPAGKNHSSPFLPTVVAAVFTGIAIARSAPDPGTAALIFLLIFYFAYMAKATWANLTSGLTDSGYSQQDPESHLFCPDCQIMQSHAALCSMCRGPLEPMAHWKWVPDIEKLPVSSFETTAPLPEPNLTIPATPANHGNFPKPATRTISLSLPTKRMILAAKIGVDEFRILKDLMDENIFAAVNPRISDRDVLASLGRKYRVAFHFVT